MKRGETSISRRERAIWLHLCAGRTTRDIAARLETSMKTIAAQRVSLYQKLSIRAPDIPALVRAAAAADILRELPPLVVPISAPPNGASPYKYP